MVLYDEYKDNSNSNIKSVQGYKSKCGVNGIVVVNYMNVSNSFLYAQKRAACWKRLPAAVV